MVDLPESGCRDPPGSLNRSEVREGHTERAIGGPSASLVEVGQAKLVDPDLAALEVLSVVADADHNRAHLSERRVAHHAHLIHLPLRIHLGIDRGKRYPRTTLALGSVALILQIGKHLGREVDHIAFRPNGGAVGLAAAIVSSGRGEGEGYLILVVVVLVVRSESDEHGQLAIGQAGDVVDQSLGVNEELEALVATHVVFGTLVDGACVLRGQIGDLQREGLLVLLPDLRLAGVGHSGDARRQDIVDRLAVAILLYVDGSDVEGAVH